jgi:ribulose bisphosphate carboxylase small subunit
MELTVLGDRGEMEIAIINDMLGLAEHLQDKEMQEAVKVYFGDNYDYAKSIYEEFKRHGHAEIERHFIDDNTLARINSISVEVLKEYDKYKEKIECEVNRLFGIDLPKKLNLVTILIQKPKVLSDGGVYLDDMGVITLRIYNDIDLEKEMPKIIDVLIHEILHAAFDNSGIKNRLSPAQQEALVRSFAPQGILSLLVGLIKNLDFDELYKHVSVTIRNSDDLSEFTKLFPYIKDYYAQLSYGKQNILDYLTDKINFNNKA